MRYTRRRKYFVINVFGDKAIKLLETSICLAYPDRFDFLRKVIPAELGDNAGGDTK